MKVLVAPLDWGLGHATRCVPVIREFLSQGAEVEIAVVRANASFFREVFPEVRQRLAPGYNVVYPKYGANMGLWLLKSSAHLNAVMRYEHRYAEEMVARHGYDILFSDNRFAFFSKNAHNVYMTHQRRIAFPAAFSAFEGIGIRWHEARMGRFDEVWVPDTEEFPGYAGALSHLPASTVPAVRRGGASLPVKFVGPLSRFAGMEMPAPVARGNGRRDSGLNVVAVVSGVEPARSQFEASLRKTLREIPGKHTIILGKPQLGQKSWTEGNIEFHSHLPIETFASVVRDADWVISRGGYSTVMDMAFLGAKCIFVPTPGQYEQVVLAHDLAAAGYAVHVPANRLSVKTLEESFKKDVALPKPGEGSLLHGAVADLLAGLSIGRSK